MKKTKCEDSTNKQDHTWEYFDEPKAYVALARTKDEETTIVKTIAECAVCGLELAEEDK